MPDFVHFADRYSSPHVPPCIICFRHLENIFPDTHLNTNQPNQASSLKTEGHYGDDFHDPGNGSVVEVNICSRCMEAADKRGLVVHYPTSDVSSIEYAKVRASESWFRKKSSSSVPDEVADAKRLEKAVDIWIFAAVGSICIISCIFALVVWRIV